MTRNRYCQRNKPFLHMATGCWNLQHVQRLFSQFIHFPPVYYILPKVSCFIWHQASWNWPGAPSWSSSLPSDWHPSSSTTWCRCSAPRWLSWGSIRRSDWRGRTPQTTSLREKRIRDLMGSDSVQAGETWHWSADGRGANVPPEASWAHLQVQRSLSLSLVLNWVPEWARLLTRPAVPL